jgi:peptidylprolyl isomerase
MRLSIAVTFGCALIAAGGCRAAGAPWRPTPAPGAPQAAQVVAGSAAADWQEIAPDDLLVMDIRDGERVVIQLAPDFAPVHVANIRAFARTGGWAGATIYRVQDNYVTQWGNNPGSGTAEVLPAGVVREPPAEFERPLAGLAIRDLGAPDSYAARVGHAGGWPVAYDPTAQRAWLPHCYGHVGAGRGITAPGTGTGGELYAVIGHAPRHLDRNIASVGRVIEGMAHLAARPRGSGTLGFYQRERGETPLPIARIRLASALSEAERPRFEVMRTDTPTFAAYVTGRANRSDAFFAHPAGGVDVCNAPVPIRRRPG